MTPAQEAGGINQNVEASTARGVMMLFGARLRVYVMFLSSLLLETKLKGNAGLEVGMR